MSPLLRLVVPSAPRTRATVLGIAFAVLLLVAGFALLYGLAAGVNGIADRIEPAPVLFLAGHDLESSAIDPSRAWNLPGEYLIVRAVPATLHFGGVSWSTVVASVERNDTSLVWPAPHGGILLGTVLRARVEAQTPLAQGATLELVADDQSITLEYSGVYPPTDPFPDDWVAVIPAGVLALRPSMEGSVSAIVVPPENEPAIDALRAAGLTEVRTTAAEPLLRAGVADVLAGLTPLVAVVGGIVALLVYNAMTVEVGQSAPEIRILWRAGASRGQIAALYWSRSVYLAAFGGLLGLAGGIVTAHGIIAFAPLVGLTNLIAPTVSLELAALALGLSLLAGSLGGLVPAIRAGRTKAPRREVVPSS